jgi:GLPGLI family protein
MEMFGLKHLDDNVINYSMKSISFFLLLLMLYSLESWAQERVLAKVHYKFSHINDTSKKDQPLRDDVVTYLGKTSAYYTTYSPEIIKKDISAQIASADFTGHMSLNFTTTPINNFYLLDAKNKRMETVEAVSSSFDVFTYTVTWEEQNWEIVEETKDVGGYICQKAITNFKGRMYEAWFTSELPFPFGPWKLHGLPGLILEAHDIKGEVRFAYSGFDKVLDDTKIELPFYVIKASATDIEKLRKTFKEDQTKYFQSLQNSGRMALSTDYFGIDYSKHSFDIKTDDDYKPSFNANNPIELVK